MNKKDQFVSNGRRRHFKGFKEQIANKVRSKYEDELQRSGFFSADKYSPSNFQRNRE